MTKGIVTIWHDKITPDMLRDEDVHVIEIAATTADEAKTKLKEMLDGETR
jgi:hypothetical protein